MKPQNLPRSVRKSSLRSALPGGTGRWRPLKLLLPNLLLGLTACMASPPTYDTENPPPAPAASGADAGATYSQQPSPSASAATSQFSFPMTSCGDRASEPSETWYSVYIDGASLDDIRSRYCGDAVSATRGKSGNPTVQAASFTSYAKALSLAKAIGGVVEQSASPDPNASATNSTNAAPGSPASNGSAAPSTPAPGPTPALQVGQAAYLNASDFGSPINIRSRASTAADVQSTGYAGDPVQISNSTQGDDGLTWYEVRLDSGTQGWVRGDLISTQAPVNQPRAQAPTYDSADATPAPDQGSGQDAAPYSPPSYGQAPYADPPSQAPYGQPPYANQAPSAQAPYGQAPYGQPPYANQAPYGQAPYGQPPDQRPYGQPYGPSNQGRPSTLTAQDPTASINIREGASMNARVRYRANAGDPIQVSGSAQGDDGFIWYQVRFSSGAVGWVRGDLVTMN
jgi:uncharacterized protein YgiM (DUF1202 family)